MNRFAGVMAFVLLCLIARAGVAGSAMSGAWTRDAGAERRTYTVRHLEPRARYFVRLQFAASPGDVAFRHVLDVAINGTPALLDFDVAARADAARGRTRSFATNATDAGSITLAFARRDGASIARIEVAPVAKRKRARVDVAEFEIRALDASPATLASLSDVLVETVASGGSVSFLHPLRPEEARTFWESSLASAARGERIVLGAWDGDALAGTVTLLLALPPNQPHRGEIAKMMTRVAYRGRGVATALMRVAERIAVERGRTLLTLDTATDDGASTLYERLGFTFAGEIPEYALKPLGGLTGTKLYWKRVGGTTA